MTAVGFGFGIWAAFTPPVGSVLKPPAGVLLVVAGLVLLSPFAASTPINARQRCVRKGISALGVANILAGASELVPGTWSQPILLSLAAVVMASTGAWVIRSNSARSTAV